MRVKLGDICTIVSGSTPKTNIDEYWDPRFVSSFLNYGLGIKAVIDRINANAVA